MGFGSMALVALFRRSSRLASAYGLAVCGAMLCDSLLIFLVCRSIWNWSKVLAALPAVFFVSLDLLYLFGCVGKIPVGGWIPISMSLGAIFVLNTWMSGRALMNKVREEEDRKLPLSVLANASVPRIKGTHFCASLVLLTRLSSFQGTGVFFTRRSAAVSSPLFFVLFTSAQVGVPWCLDQLYSKLGAIHERHIIIHLYVGEAVNGCSLKDLGDGMVCSYFLFLSIVCQDSGKLRFI